jgi:hypothetical protein
MLNANFFYKKKQQKFNFYVVGGFVGGMRGTGNRRLSDKKCFNLAG